MLLLRPFNRRFLTTRSNNAIIDLLNHHKHLEEESSQRNVFKIRAFEAAINVIDKLDHPIQSAEEAKKLKGVGPGITRRIEEFMSDQSTSPDTKLKSAIRRASLESLQLVSGIGPVTARKLVDAGCTKIPDLHHPQYYDMLNSGQKIALKYYKHLQTPVTREESENALAFIQDHISSKFQIHLGGSYRRGSPTSSDIDIILFHPSHVHVPTPPPPSPLTTRGRKSLPFTSSKIKSKYESNCTKKVTLTLMQDVIQPLEERGLAAATLSLGVRKWHGIILLPDLEKGEGGSRLWEERRVRLERIEKGEGMYRRMDINLVPIKSRGAALLALTGDVAFNMDIRQRAISLGLHLNEFGLWRWNGGVTDTDDVEKNEEDAKGYWEMVKAESEEEILRELGMEWVEPEKRNFEYVVGKGQGKRGKDKQKRASNSRQTVAS